MPAYASLIAAVIGFFAGYVAAGLQYHLYREPEFLEGRATGRKLLLMRVALGLALAVALGLAWRPDHYEAGPALVTSIFLVALGVLASTDFERKRLPNRLMYPALANAIALCWIWPDRSVGDIFLGGGIAFGISVALFIGGLLVGGALGFKGTPFGLGDVKLIVLLGLLCGFPAFVSALFIGAIAAGVPSVALMVTGRGRRAISYGPYLILGCAIVLLWPGQFVV